MDAKAIAEGGEIVIGVNNSSPGAAALLGDERVAMGNRDTGAAQSEDQATGFGPIQFEGLDPPQASEKMLKIQELPFGACPALTR